eukprot:TRINITY_DN31079_c0_g1_i1.p1 TRINITY_DN31079_c0_g1~~TRINITY_DN31079_c0_g1_i1.p1  ORF type:complete len:185 (+),score=20.32 TRINITY_DN31079_c0_g1_i1:72-626(+)
MLGVSDKGILTGIAVLGMIVGGTVTFAPGSIVSFGSDTQCGLFQCVGQYSSFSMSDIAAICGNEELFQSARWMFVVSFAFQLAMALLHLYMLLKKSERLVVCCPSLLSAVHASSALVFIAAWVCSYFVVRDSPHGSPSWGFYLIWISIATEISLTLVCLPYFELFKAGEIKEVRGPDSEDSTSV